MREPFSFGEFDPGALAPMARNGGLVLAGVILALLLVSGFTAAG